MSLELNEIRKSFRQPDGTEIPVLDVPEFRIASSEQVVLLGSSGGGKTTLLNIISGITRPDSGTVRIDGIDVSGLSEPARDRFRAQRIGYVFQTFNLLPAFTALENVLLGMSFSGRRADQNRAKELLDQVGLSHRLNNRPTQLSVGEQQRVAVARSLVNRPVLLLADEPTANVDVSNQGVILNLIQSACREQEVSLLLVTHSEEVAGTFNRIERLASFNQAGAN